MTQEKAINHLATLVADTFDDGLNDPTASLVYKTPIACTEEFVRNLVLDIKDELIKRGYPITDAVAGSSKVDNGLVYVTSLCFRRGDK